MQKSTDNVSVPPLVGSLETPVKHEKLTIVKDAENENVDVEVEFDTLDAAVKPVNDLKQTPTNADLKDKEASPDVNSPLKLETEKAETHTVNTHFKTDSTCI